MVSAKVEIKDKITLSFEEAAAYSGIGIGRLRALASRRPELVLVIGTKKQIKRIPLEKFIENASSV